MKKDSMFWVCIWLITISVSVNTLAVVMREQNRHLKRIIEFMERQQQQQPAPAMWFPNMEAA